MIRDKIKELLTALVLISVSIFVGVMGFMLIEDFAFNDAFYMTVITISTVGFQEVQELTDQGQWFVSFYILFNLAAFAYFLSVISKFLFEGELKNIFRSMLFSQELKSLKNHVIICGCGRNGYKACVELMNDGVDFVVVDQDEAKVRDLFGEKMEEINYFIGDATDEEVLKKTGIDKAKAIIAAVASDAINVFIALSARELNSKINIIARANEISSEGKLYRAGANNVVMPDVIGGHYMALIVNKPHVVNFLEMINGVGDIKLSLEELGKQDFKPEFQGKSIAELNMRAVSAVTVVGYKSLQEGYVFNPKSGTILQEGEFFILLGKDGDLASFKTHFTNLPN